jgi:preprotein translocase subunit SecF
VELLKQSSINWLGKKWWFLAISLFALAMGVAGYWMHGGLNYGIDFTGGAIVRIKFDHSPDLNLIRDALKPGADSPPLIQRFGKTDENTVQVRMQTVAGAEGTINAGRESMISMLRRVFDREHVGVKQIDFNNAGLDSLSRYLVSADPDNLKAQNKTSQEIETYYGNLAQAMIDYRDKVGGGLVASLDSLKNAQGVSGSVINSLKQGYFAGPFAIKSTEIVGAVVGSDLRRRAGLAVGLSILGMLVYIAFRFKPIYGVAAVLALIHDVTITLGLFALTQKEISLTVIAALLTLIGYSVNDTIVIFDRVRENLRLLRKESLFKILNTSINQTLSRTIMTSGFTFLAVFSLFLFGGEVLNGFSFALTVGIILGSYSTIALASTVVEWWYRSIEKNSKRKTA